ncbi:hypothetical protein RIF29_17197 [Crotalaria pallida]|uniref:Uncharacterized protein n=1 Tax=Crotalaria pallida TaxID=3830 RepID=A0AAN9FHS1_CROPI
MMKRGLSYSDDDEDEVEVVHLRLSNYHLEDDVEMHVSFSMLPIKRSDFEDFDSPKEKVYIHGYVDKMPKMLQVKAWRFDLSSVKPSISLLKKWKVDQPSEPEEEL